MIKAKDTPSKTAAEVELLGEERQRLGRIERQLTDRLARDMTGGQVIFRGKLDDAPAGTLAQSAQKLMTERISEIYDRLDSFAAQLSTKDVMTVLRTDDLGTVNDALTESGIGLVTLTPQGYQFATESGPLDDLLKISQERDELRPCRHRRAAGHQAGRTAPGCTRSRSCRPLRRRAAGRPARGHVPGRQDRRTVGPSAGPRVRQDHRLPRLVICPADRGPERGNPSPNSLPASGS